MVIRVSFDILSIQDTNLTQPNPTDTKWLAN